MKNDEGDEVTMKDDEGDEFTRREKYDNERAERRAERTMRAKFCKVDEGGEGKAKDHGLDYAPDLTVEEKVLWTPDNRIARQGLCRGSYPDAHGQSACSRTSALGNRRADMRPWQR